MTKHVKPDWPPVLTLGELADYLRVSTETAAALCRSGQVPGAYRTSGRTGHWRCTLVGAQKYTEIAAQQAGQ